MKVLVYGLGRSGTAACRLLRQQGHTVWAYDQSYNQTYSQTPPGEAWGGLEQQGVTFTRDPLATPAERCIAAPGVPWDHPDLRTLRDRGIETIGEVEWVYRTTRATMVGVTGTAGKGTVTGWLTDVLKRAGRDARAGGNIDPALAAVVLDGVTDETLLVVECSSFMLERCPTLTPRVAVLLNLGVDHLDRHGSVAAYHAAKKNLIANLGASDTLVYNHDDPLLRDWAAHTPATTLAYSLTGHGDATLHTTLRGDTLTLFGDPLLDTAALSVGGRHNHANALAVALAAHALGVDRATLRAALPRFAGLPGRYSLVAQLGGVRFIEDSIATRTLSVKAALEASHPPIAWIAGGVDKGADVAALEALIRAKVSLMLGVGRAGEAFVTAVRGWTETMQVTDTDGETALQVACTAGYGHLKTRHQGVGTVLLAPLAASFDQFKDYTARAHAFRRAVGALVQTHEGATWTRC